MFATKIAAQARRMRCPHCGVYDGPCYSAPSGAKYHAVRWARAKRFLELLGEGPK